MAIAEGCARRSESISEGAFVGVTCVLCAVCGSALGSPPYARIEPGAHEGSAAQPVPGQGHLKFPVSGLPC